jgi:hypothetical protein
MKYYCGVGSRQTPVFICELFTEIAKELSGEYILRSGGADGADTAFENGAGENKEIWLPWKKFNKNTSTLTFDKRATDILKTVIDDVHFSNLTDAAIRLHSRNVHQIMGLLDDNNMSSFVLCWTVDAQDNFGGTATAIKLAKKLGVPVYNFGKCADLNEALNYWHKVKILENIL